MKAKRAVRRVERGLDRSPDPVLVLRRRVQEATVAAARLYTLEPFAGRLCLLLPNHEWAQSRYLPMSWGALAREADVYVGDEGCDQNNMLREPYAGAFAAYLAQCVSASPRRGGPVGQRAEEEFIPQST